MQQLTFFSGNVIKIEIKLKASKAFNSRKQNSDSKSIPVACAMKRGLILCEWVDVLLISRGERRECASTSANTKYIHRQKTQHGRYVEHDETTQTHKMHRAPTDTDVGDEPLKAAECHNILPLFSNRKRHSSSSKGDRVRCPSQSFPDILPQEFNVSIRGYSKKNGQSGDKIKKHVKYLRKNYCKGGTGVCGQEKIQNTTQFPRRPTEKVGQGVPSFQAGK